MRPGPPQRPDGFLCWQRAEVVAVCQASGLVLALAGLTCSLLGVISAQQAVALGLPAAVLVIGDLIVASVPDPSTSSRLGFQAGRRAGAIVNLWRSRVRHRGSDL